MSNNNEARALTPEVVAQLYSIPKGNLANWRTNKRGPRYFKKGRRIFYRTTDLESWLFSEPQQTVDSVRDIKAV